MKLFQLNNDCDEECSCIAPGETETEAKENTGCRNALPCCDAYEITTVTDKDGNKFRIMLLPDLSCEGGGCCARCGEEAKTGG
jgi:hypothetical protein